MSEEDKNLILQMLRGIKESHDRDSQHTKEMMDAMKEMYKGDLQDMKDSIQKIEKHLENQNGKVFKNTSFRLKWSGVFVFIGIVGSLAGITGSVLGIVMFFSQQ